MQQLIAVDLDEVLADFIGTFLDYYNELYQSTHRKEDFVSYHLEETIGGTKEDMVRKILAFYAHDRFRLVEPVAGATEAVAHLAKTTRLIIVTARPKQFSRETEVWVETHFPKTFSDIFYTYNPHSRLGLGSKAEVCQQIGARALVDDAFENSLDFVNHPTKFLLFTQPWNIAFTTPGSMQRVNSWDEVRNVVEKL